MRKYRLNDGTSEADDREQMLAAALAHLVRRRTPRAKRIAAEVEQALAPTEFAVATPSEATDVAQVETSAGIVEVPVTSEQREQMLATALSSLKRTRRAKRLAAEVDHALAAENLVVAAPDESMSVAQVATSEGVVDVPVMNVDDLEWASSEDILELTRDNPESDDERERMMAAALASLGGRKRKRKARAAEPAPVPMLAEPVVEAEDEDEDEDRYAELAEAADDLVEAFAVFDDHLKVADEDVYRQWAAGGKLTTSEYVSMYPSAEDAVEKAKERGLERYRARFPDEEPSDEDEDNFMMGVVAPEELTDALRGLEKAVFEFDYALRNADSFIYERWKAGGKQATSEYASMYPAAEAAVEEVKERAAERGRRNNPESDDERERMLAAALASLGGRKRKARAAEPAPVPMLAEPVVEVAPAPAVDPSQFYIGTQFNLLRAYRALGGAEGLLADYLHSLPEAEIKRITKAERMRTGTKEEMISALAREAERQNNRGTVFLTYDGPSAEGAVQAIDAAQRTAKTARSVVETTGLRESIEQLLAKMSPQDLKQVAQHYNINLNRTPADRREATIIEQTFGYILRNRAIRGDYQEDQDEDRREFWEKQRRMIDAHRERQGLPPLTDEEFAQQLAAGRRNNPEWARKLGHAAYKGTRRAAKYAAEVGTDLYHGAKSAHHEYRRKK